MPARRGIKREPQDPSLTPVASAPSNNIMAPPSRNLRTSTRENTIDAQSAAPSFMRSHAPSAETRRQQDDDHEPMFLEMREAKPKGSFQDESASAQNANSSFAHQSFVHPTFTDIGMKLRAFNDVHGNLQRLGVANEAAAKLPELVLVGDQSAGKSSLMCGIARVDIPRSAGVGTRCPLHIQLSDNNHWSCTVALQMDYDFEPRGPIRKSDVTNANPFPPWVKRTHRETKLFKTIYNPNEIEEVLKWAQVAILNPTSNHELYIPGEGAVAKDTDLAVATRDAAAQFSPNIISLEIRAPDAFNLSFYDLPGVFLSPDQEEDEYIVKVVRNLTKAYVQSETAIIMWALPMNADPENSISLGIIREARASDRTIGIMTKADMLAAEDCDQWLAMFRGNKQSVGHGFFATSRPNKEEDAGKWEELFFAQEIGEWPDSFTQFQDRCGVDRLSQYISVQLGNAFAKSLPQTKSRVEQRYREIQHQLSGLPELPSNVEYEVKRSLQEFLFRMKMAIKDSSFSSEWNKLNGQFRDVVLKIKPTCRVKEPEAQTIDLSDADTEVSAVTPSKRPRPSDSTVRQSPSIRRIRPEVNDTPVKQEGFTTPTGMNGIRAQSVVNGVGPALNMSSPFWSFRNLGRLSMDIRDIRDEVRRKQRPGMPRDLVPDEVRETLCLNAVRKWERPLDKYVDETEKLLKQVTNQVLEESLGVLRRRLIFKECQTHLIEFIDSAVASQRARLIDMFEAETYQIYMMNEDVFRRYKAQELDHLRRARSIYRLKAVARLGWDYNIKTLDEMTEEEKAWEMKTFNTYLPKMGADPFETEIEVAAFVRGYYMTAANRFVEGATMSVNSFLFRTVGGTQLDMHMDKKLRISDASVYEHLMEEDEKTARLREQLKEKIDRLSEAMASINGLETSSANGSNSGLSNGTLQREATIELDGEDDMMDTDDV
ncbi:dynamin family protein [Xylariaceae sp. FL1019]|nr:dynamin family protein [Xylariaceae sp. FL1019]